MGAVIIAGRFVPRPPIDDPWNKVSSPVPPVQRLVGGGFPFVPTRWRFNYDDAAVWTVESFPAAPVQKLIGGNYPFKPPYWKQHYNDAPVWSGAPRNVNRIIDIEPPVIPTRFRFGQDDSAYWVNESAPISTPLIQALANNVPFKPLRWRNDYDDASRWMVESFPVPKVQALVGGGYPFVPQRWKYHHYEYGAWNAKATGVNRVIDLAFVPPFVPARWKIDYDDASVWNGRSIAVPGYFIPLATISGSFTVTEAPDTMVFSGTVVVSNWVAAHEPSSTWAGENAPSSGWSNMANPSSSWANETDALANWTPATIDKETWN